MRQGNVFHLGMHLFRVGDSVKPLHIWSLDPTTSSAFADFIFPHVQTDFRETFLFRMRFTALC